MLDSWLLLLLRLCSVTRLSSSSSSMRKGCDEVGSSSGQEYCWRKGWDSAASAVSRSMGLKVKIRSRKSTAERRRQGNHRVRKVNSALIPWNICLSIYPLSRGYFLCAKIELHHQMSLWYHLFIHLYLFSIWNLASIIILISIYQFHFSLLDLPLLSSLCLPWESTSGSSSEKGFFTLHPWLIYEGITWKRWQWMKKMYT